MRAALHVVPETSDDDRPSGEAPIRVVLADDHAFLRRTLRMLLDGERDLDVVAEAENGAGLAQHVHTHQPRVLVLSVSTPGGSSLTTIRELRTRAPETAIVVTTMIDDPRFARETLAAGASGYVLTESADRDLPEAIRCAAAGRTFVTPQVSSALSAYDRAGRDLLSPREVDVLRLVALGYTNAEIGQRLQLSTRTVETHRSHIHRKLRLSSRADLVRYALRRGLLEPVAREADR